MKVMVLYVSINMTLNSLFNLLRTIFWEKLLKKLPNPFLRALSFIFFKVTYLSISFKVTVQ